MKLDARIPSGPLERKWTQAKFELKLVNPANKRKYTILMVGSGLAGAGGAAALAELGYEVECFCYQDSPRRAHSIAAQGGINASKNYHNDGDSVFRLFYDTVKGGDFRAREANVYRLAEVSVNIIDQCAALGLHVRGRLRETHDPPIAHHRRQRRQAGQHQRRIQRLHRRSECGLIRLRGQPAAVPRLA